MKRNAGPEAKGEVLGTRLDEVLFLFFKKLPNEKGEHNCKRTEIGHLLDARCYSPFENFPQAATKRAFLDVHKYETPIG